MTWKILPGTQCGQTLNGERFEEIEDVDFGKARTFRGREAKAKAAGYVKNYITVDSGDIISVFRRLKN